ncbi:MULTISPECIES: hypothetical protein [unclassified Microcoleus]|uniref:hypothetical protein n=1 Tax=unclassified Microcoleus TaxID=2642155 RepID=UPI002FD35146
MSAYFIFILYNLAAYQLNYKPNLEGLGGLNSHENEEKKDKIVNKAVKNREIKVILYRP